MRLPVESPTLYGRREADRERPAPRRGAAGWIAAAILIVAALSLAVVTTRPRRVAPLPIPKPVEPAPARAPAPATTMATAIDAVAAAPPPAALESAPVPIGEERDRTASVPPPPEAAATGRVPDRMKPIYPPPPPRPRYRTIETAIPDTAKASPPASAPPEPAERGDEAATTSDWRPEFQRATERSRAAARTKSAAAFDEAADAWELVIPRLADEPEEEARARHEVARARYQAWLAGASIARRDAAIHATRAYLLLAPPGPDRDLAWAWLGRLKH